MDSWTIIMWALNIVGAISFTVVAVWIVEAIENQRYMVAFAAIIVSIITSRMPLVVASLI